MKTIKHSVYLLLLPLILATFSCKKAASTTTDPLASWNEGAAKRAIVAFMDSVRLIPDSDRIAVFDLDGTVACEQPLWMEMYAAVNGLNQQSKANQALLKQPEYQFALKLGKNPADSTVQKVWGPYIDSMVLKAYAGVDYETYIDSARAYLTRTKNPNFDIALADLFYQPMVELIRYLQANRFSVYIVSGSMEGTLWSVCPQVLGLNRAHLIGSRQMLNPHYNPQARKTSFVIGKGVFLPKNNNSGKSIDIYNVLGKTPVFAFGNTVNDFDMLHFASTSKYPHAAFLLNHDDAAREYAYRPYYSDHPVPAWQDSMKINGWHLVNMKEDFKVVWWKK